MRAAEEGLIASGSSVDALMQRAGQGAAEWVWRMAAGRRVTVLCGPGNNGGDGYVIAEAIRARGGEVSVIAAMMPTTPAARNAAALYRGVVRDEHAEPAGDVLIDCLFGSGLTRPLLPAHAALLQRLGASHRHSIAIDVPSGVGSDSGLCLNDGLPQFDLTVSLGAWKYAHFLMPAAALMGGLRLVDIGVAPVTGAGAVVRRPRLHPPAADAHKYRRGLLAVVAGEMPGAGLLACIAAQHAGAGYVKLLSEHQLTAPCDLVVEEGDLAKRLSDKRISAGLVGPGLGRDDTAHQRLMAALHCAAPMVVDADALMLLTPDLLGARHAPTIATPHEGELAALEHAYGLAGSGSKVERAGALAAASGMVVVAKGPDTVIAAPDGRIACSPRASTWLSTAGTGDVLAGTIASRLATGVEAFTAAGEGIWLHGEAARRTPPPFTAGALAQGIAGAFAACL
ncbi:MAG: NAD(P)H-hydrate epimerase [Pseudomonadota bacterium]|nr:NAD(P)H-hydrate epimerase [Pseudomonadota bacterium]